MPHGNAGQQRRGTYTFYRHERAYKLRQMGLSLDFVGQLLGVSRERVRQMESWYSYWVVVKGVREWDHAGDH